jgi:hypothetical protein
VPIEEEEEEEEAYVAVRRNLLRSLVCRVKFRLVTGQAMYRVTMKETDTFNVVLKRNY